MSSPTRRRTLGRGLYSAYLVALVLGTVGLLVAADGAGAATAAPAVRVVLAGVALVWVIAAVATAAVSGPPALAVLPALTHLVRRPAHLGVSLASGLIAAAAAVAVPAAIVGMVVGRSVAPGVQPVVHFGVVGASTGVLSCALRVVVSSRRSSVRRLGAMATVICGFGVVGATHSTGAAVTVAAAGAALTGLTVAGAAVETVGISPLYRRAHERSATMPDLYLATAADIHLGLRVVQPGFTRWRVPTDGWFGLVRLAAIGALGTALLAVAPSEGYGYAATAGVLFHWVAVELHAGLRVDVGVHDRAPLTVPLSAVRGRLARRMAPASLGVLVGVWGVSAAGHGMAEWVVAVAMGHLSALVAVAARVLNVATLATAGPDVLGAVILARLIGPVGCAAVATAGAHGAAAGRPHAAMVILAVAAVCLAALAVMAWRR